MHDPAAYGRRLGQDVFQVPGVRESWPSCKSRGLDLRFRLSIAPSETEVHGLRWETLADPDAPAPGAPLLMSERILFSRYVDSGDWRPVPRAPRAMCALSSWSPTPAISIATSSPRSMCQGKSARPQRDDAGYRDRRAG